MLKVDKKFACKEDEIQYWMDVAHQMCQRKTIIEQELEEYRESSITYEKELETSCEQSDKTIRDLRRENRKLTKSIEQLKIRLNDQMSISSIFQSNYHNVKTQNEQLLKVIRNLEQKNDDLERTNRETKVSEEEIEHRYNNVLEKLALLETEVDEKEALEITVQRLKDENSDLKQQLKVEQNYRNTISDYINLSDKLVVEKDYNKVPDPNVSDYLRKLEDKVIFLESAYKISKQNEGELMIQFKAAVKRANQLETELKEKSNYKATIQQLKDDHEDMSEKLEMRLRSNTEKDRIRPDSYSSGASQSDKERNSVHSIRAIDKKTKKVKEAKEFKDMKVEEKRSQNVFWLFKRLRYPHSSWARRKD